MKQIKFNIDENGKTKIDIDKEFTTEELNEIAFKLIKTLALVNLIRCTKKEDDK